MVDLSPRTGPSSEQLLYARVLDYGMKAGLALLIAGFAVYVGGLLPLQVPLQELPRLWVLPVGDYLRESGAVVQWYSAEVLRRGDVLALAGIVFLAGVSVPCLLLAGWAYAARRDWYYVAITVTLAGVLALAASGVLVLH